MNFFKKALSLLNKNEKIFLVFFLILSIITSFLEIIGIGLIIPIIYSIVDKKLLAENEIIIFVNNYLNLEPNQILYLIISSFVFVVFTKALLLTYQGYLQLNYFSKIHIRLFNDYFKKYLTSSWTFFMNTNTATLMRNFHSGISDYSGKLLSYFVVFFSEIILILVLVIFLLFLYPKISLIAFSILITIGLIVQRLTKKYNYRLGAIRQKYTALINKQIIQSFRITKLLKIMGKEKKFTDVFDELVTYETRSKHIQLFVERLPRIWIEFVFLCIIIISVIFFIKMGNEYEELLILLVTFSLVGFRLLPSLNKLLLCIQHIRYSAVTVDILVDEAKKLSRNSLKNFDNSKKLEIDDYKIELKDISFKYENSKDFLFKNLNMSIEKNSSIAIIGKSGVGKSTLVDIIIGVLEPIKGKIFIGKEDIKTIKNSWIKNIGYVPQDTYILDESLKKNIALGDDNNEIDEIKIREIITLLELESLVNRSSLGLDVILGDNGAKLSGGQKQRIGIARALYLNPKILILDESTSSLDLDTEKKILSIIQKLKNKMTIIIISHRDTVINFCENVVKLNFVNEK